MNKVLELKTKAIEFVERNEAFAKAIARLAVMMVAFLMVYFNLGFYSKMHIIVVPIVLALVCAILPFSVGILILSLYVLLNLYGLGLEVTMVGAALMVLCYLLYLRFAPKKSYLVVLSSVLWSLRIPYVAPVAVGLRSNPGNVVAVLMGTVMYYFLRGVHVNSTVFVNSGSANAASMLNVALKQVIGNTQMWVVLVAFLVTAVVVYSIRRKSIRNAWRAAIYIGTMLQVILILGGKLLLGDYSGIVGFIVGTIVSLGIEIGFEFIMCHLDYSRVERAQFEDDYYYYYVKAVPKVLVKGQEKKVTTFGNVKQESITRQDEGE